MNDALIEAKRAMTICNACRYCEGYCAVFPAMALRRVLPDPDTKYLSNLCHNCRACYYACQYAPPHEFGVNVPKALAELRLETYIESSGLRLTSGISRRSGVVASLITCASLVGLLVAVLLTGGPSVLFSRHTGANAFYVILPYPYLVISMSALGLLVLSLLAVGLARFWRETGGSRNALTGVRANRQAIRDVLGLRYLEGYGQGCSYPDGRFRLVRRRFHHCLFYGFWLCFASTTVAAIYDHLLHIPAPYPVLSLPVILGSAGGLALLVGSTGSLCLKLRMDKMPASPRLLSLDVGFLILLFLTSLSGLLLLLFRETPAMGSLLIIHLAIVIALFVTMPYGKFVHGVYRYAALVRNAVEQSEEDGT